jgi:hypothetical protein
LGQFLGQVATAHELHRIIGPAFYLADLVHLHDVRMLQLGKDLGLLAEAGQPLAVSPATGQDHFEGHDPPRASLPSLKDNPHPSSPETPHDGVGAKPSHFPGPLGRLQ